MEDNSNNEDCHENVDIENLKDLKDVLQKQDNSENFTYFSKVPDICKTESCIVGVDEAGRGPVLGPMVYAIAYCPASKSNQLEELKCADSKTLTETKRNELLLEICTAADFVGWAVDVNSPNKICNSMLSRVKISLNEIALKSTIKLIENALTLGINIKEVFVDTVGPPEKHQKTLTEHFASSKIKFTVEKKADSLFPIVSTASICAKVTRDHALEVWKFPEDFQTTHEEFGSGYPNDPLTKRYLKSNIDRVFGYPQLVRFSWSTCENALKDSAAEVVWSDVEDENETKNKGKNKTVEIKKPGAKNAKITSFFTKQKKNAFNDDDDVQLPNFFTARFLSHVEKL